ncbi:hypothetical protein D3C76_1237810 [compost metagenome]
MGLFGVDQIARPLRFVGEAHQQSILTHLGVAGEPGSRIGPLYPDGHLEGAEDGGHQIHVEAIGPGGGIQRLQRCFQGAADDQLLGRQPTGQQQAEQQQAAQITSPTHGAGSPAFGYIGRQIGNRGDPGWQILK